MPEPLVDTSPTGRSTSYGQGAEFSLLDRAGTWLSARRIWQVAGDTRRMDVADLGCGYSAKLSQPLFGRVRSLLLMDLHLDPALAGQAGVRTIEAALPDGLKRLGADSLDLILCNNVIEHLSAPQDTVAECHRLLRPGGRLFVNVPSWRGKYFLELAAFKFRLAPAIEMNDHKMYYDPRDLWPLLVRAGFRPQEIKLGRHKFGLNTFSVCAKSQRVVS